MPSTSQLQQQAARRDQEVRGQLRRLEYKANLSRAASTTPGAGAEIQAATLDVPAPAVTRAEIVVIDAAVDPTTRIMAVFAPLADGENDIEELADTALRLVPVAESGQIRFHLSGNAPFTGPFPVHYLLSTP
jgi:hypothetical protein